MGNFENEIDSKYYSGEELEDRINWIERRMCYLESIHESLKKELRIKDILLFIILGMLIGICFLQII